MHCCKNFVSAGLFTLAVGTLASVVMSSGFSALAQDKPAPRPAAPTIKSPPTGDGKSLYDRLGGTYPIAALVDDYVNRLPTDATIMGNPNVKAAVEKAAGNNGLPGLKYQITAIIIEACGGPYKYHGRDMYDSHKDLHITQAEWDAGVLVLKASLDKFHVPADQQAELNALIAKTHDQIVIPAGRMP